MNKRPIQIYMDEGDRRLLDALAARHGLSMAETIRGAIRRWASEGREEVDPILALVGTMDSEGLPANLSTRHDEYAVYWYARTTERVAEKKDDRDS